MEDDSLVQDDESSRPSPPLLPTPQCLTLKRKSDTSLEDDNDDDDAIEDDNAMDNDEAQMFLTEMQHIASATQELQAEWQSILDQQQVLDDASDALQAQVQMAWMNHDVFTRTTRLKEAFQLQKEKIDNHKKKIPALEFDTACFKLRYSHRFQTGTLPDSTSAAAAAAAALLAQVPIIEIKPELFPMGYAKPLVEALIHGRPRLTSLAIRVQQLLPDGFYDNGESTSHEHNLSTAHAYIQPLVRYVQTDTNLRQVQLSGYAPDPTLDLFLVESFLTAAASNPHVVDVKYNCAISAPAFGAFLKRAAFVKSLDVDFEISNYYDTDEHAALHDGFSAVSSTLDKLTLQVESLHENPGLTVAILRAFGTPSSLALKELKLIGEQLIFNDDMPAAYWEALAAVLQAFTIGAALEHLELVRHRFDGQRMATLLNGSIQTSSSDRSSLVETTVSKLSLCGCIFDEAATVALIDFMQTPTTMSTATSSDNGSGGSCVAGKANECSLSSSSSSTLRELHFGVNSEVMFPLEHRIGPTIASMLLLQPPNPERIDRRLWCPTIGSQLHTLSLTNYATQCRGFLLTLRQAAPERIQLVALRLTQIKRRDCVQLQRCLSKFSCDEANLFTTAQSRRVPAYQERNQFLLRLFGTSSIGSNGVVVALSDCVGEFLPMDQSLHPSMYQAVQPTPSAESRMLLRGLKTLCESIGN